MQNGNYHCSNHCRNYNNFSNNTLSKVNSHLSFIIKGEELIIIITNLITFQCRRLVKAQNTKILNNVAISDQNDLTLRTITT